jgi:hypothetical protein
MTQLGKVEQRWGLRLPDQHRRALHDPSDPIHAVCDFLVLDSEHKFLELLGLNERIHSRPFDPWPGELFAFASNGCGDYFAYHLLGDGRLEVVYMDPDKTVQENLETRDRSMHFDSFEAWYEYKTRSR